MQLFSQIWKQFKAEAEALNVTVLVDCQNKKKIGKVKGSNIVKCIQKKYFNYIIDKIASLRRNFPKALVILAWFLLLFLLLFLLVVSRSLAFNLEVFQSEPFRISVV